ncbi:MULTISPECIES: branched-chain amino acid ABC transporter permease [Cytobacillus]|uniref:branched-chain amino acid ABC transporter permease n=1 Tax=Cytobacillus TaxID=2675230 RepID=UPI0020416B0D|nr:branched-chain amino acid ABC transporter permease [Cytobacillus firmus]MCM3704704.1 branched-chain amino acid ABC transporter permease [Cytobacillus firmus]
MLLFMLMFPFVNDTRSTLILLTQIFIFAIFAMSFDILLGYTGIVSFGHCMFFGIGAYSTAIIFNKLDATMPNFLIGLLIGIFLSALVSYLIGLLSLRLKSHFYAMLTLAVSQLFLVLAEKWRGLTHGGDGFTFSVPDIFKDRTSFYYITLISMAIVFILLKLITELSTGRVLKAISQNEDRAEALGYKTLHYKLIASVTAGVAASFSGALYAISLRFINTNVFSIEVTLDALLMTMIGGLGTLAGAIAGAGIIEFLRHYLSELAMTYPIFERWTIILGILYIVVLLGFPSGLAGVIKRLTLRNGRKGRKNREAGRAA